MSAAVAPAIERRRRASARPRLTVALVNNMPDAALKSTERQFRQLVTRRMRAEDVDFRVFYLPSVERSPAGQDYCQTHYRPIADLLETTVDTLVVTGCEPQHPSLRDEPFWAEFTRLVDWARTHTRSALWSCLAAHAAVLHLDGIERQRLPQKLSGIFASEQTRAHALLAGLPERLRMPHSRLNTLPEAALQAQGYEVLTRLDEGGPDVFAKATPSLFLFLQGHPEYERDSLGREYRRDLDRFRSGATSTAPQPPANYFTADTAARLPDAAERDAVAALIDSVPDADWHAPAAQLYRNWLGLVAERLRADRDPGPTPG